MNPPVIVGAVSRKLIATLATGPKTLGEIAIALYGADDYENRFTARQVIYYLRRTKGVAIRREMRYVLRRGKHRHDCPHAAHFQELVQDGRTVYELADAINGTVRQVQNLVFRLRRHGVKIDVEAKYVLKSGGNTTMTDWLNDEVTA